jgi:competence protein ComEA
LESYPFTIEKVIFKQIMQKKHRSIKSLSFSKSEIRGLLILLVIVLILFISRQIIRRNNQALQLAYQQVEYEPEQENMGQSTYHTRDKHQRKINEGVKSEAIGPFDPNSCGYAELIDRGIPVTAAKHIIAYRKKGGKFFRTEDLLKIYGIDSSIYLNIRQNIVIKLQKEIREDNSFKPTKVYFEVDLNHTDTSELIKLPGIGHKLSGRIIKYRNALGGFYSPQQLTEVYGITDSLYRSLAAYLITDTLTIKKINLNTVSLEELQKHPYMNYYQAKAILGYRRLVGPFTKQEEVVNNYLIPDENYNKFRHYLLVE